MVAKESVVVDGEIHSEREPDAVVPGRKVKAHDPVTTVRIDR